MSELLTVLGAETARFAKLVGSTTGEDLSRPVPGLDWNVAQVATHMLSVYGFFAAAIRGEDLAGIFSGVGAWPTMPQQLAAANAHILAMATFDAPAQAGAMLADAAAEVLAALAGADFEQSVPTPWYGPSVTRTIGTLAGLVGTETLVHRRDIEVAMGRRGRLDPDTTALVMPVVMSQMLPLLVNRETVRGVKVGFEIRLRGAGRFRIDIAEGSAVSGPAVGPVDCVLSLTPAAALLSSFARVPLWRLILAGQIVPFGRKPWLGTRFYDYFLRA
ncbi:uncharacterized protein (TIGR03083 family) [Allocatelliglobosispora scoriae]|uniref:Uncharacterized protein (TIGR03083 family) n=1 Tax=Allocatelliglobosispora scoriae TaxID=643052 RepID=A0A841BI31_9ACTN|nr:maleylpyruvate isomerase family mycothiol-dependent enzyme [Allocatelliglobosispora scoriae]MBB5866836.1 uncharacterized protein (TIGR03083 family) [Allocatelliglobosispora scoriae]